MLVTNVLATLALPLLALAAPLEKKGGNSRFTWYDTEVGKGACGNFNENWKKTVALNTKDYNRFGGGYPSGACGKKVWISYNGKKLWAKVADECPTCPDGGVDLSRGLFGQLASLDAGMLTGSWGWSNKAKSRDFEDDEDDFEDEEDVEI